MPAATNPRDFFPRLIVRDADAAIRILSECLRRRACGTLCRTRWLAWFMQSSR